MQFILLTVLSRWSRCKSFSLLLCSLYLRRFDLCLCFVLAFFSPFSDAITSLGEERASRGAFRTFVRFLLFFFFFVCFLFLFLSVSGNGCGL